MSRSGILKAATAFVVLPVLSFEAFAILVAIHGSWNIEGVVETLWMTGAFLDPLMVLAGLYITRSSQIMGPALVVVGSLVVGALWFWFPPFWFVVPVVAAIGVFRARQFSNTRQMGKSYAL